MIVTLTKPEMKCLFRQFIYTHNDGGFQRFLVDLQDKVNMKTGEINLTKRDLERIPRYAFKYGKGGWENRFVGAFGRVLGKRLGSTVNYKLQAKKKPAKKVAP
jgi:hypothetical protein